MTNAKRFPADEAIHHTGQRGPMVVLASDHDAETDRLQRHLDSRNEQIDGYERQLGIDKAGAEHTIGSEIERLTRERDVSRAAIEQLHAAVKTAQELAARRLMEIERLQKREKDLMDVIDSRDRALGFVPLDDALHPGPSISKAFANSPRRVSHEPGVVTRLPVPGTQMTRLSDIADELIRQLRKQGMEKMQSVFDGMRLRIDPWPEPQGASRDQPACEDLAYYDGARAAAAMAHQSLSVMDKWINGGCGGRWQEAKAALSASRDASSEPKCGLCGKPGITEFVRTCCAEGRARDLATARTAKRT